MNFGFTTESGNVVQDCSMGVGRDVDGFSDSEDFVEIFDSSTGIKYWEQCVNVRVHTGFQGGIDNVP